jgi:hypothetical protein
MAELLIRHESPEMGIPETPRIPDDFFPGRMMCPVIRVFPAFSFSPGDPRRNRDGPSSGKTPKIYTLEKHHRSSGDATLLLMAELA